MIGQTLLQALSQVTLKVALQNMPAWEWSGTYLLRHVLMNGWLMVAVVLIVAANVAWFFVLKYFPFSYAYPLTALGFVIGLVLSILILHETVIWSQWVGVMLIMSGCFLLLR